ncbi:hypothetical protein FHL15_007333 [Xylaria flabelliformis]|uniref:DUF4604 domain-containing protein n=1 Tax=Xylaria flabelliformis TaxID=2512241 RepID=A0A553HV05_9PEZI|nr:hypothetical protein FHL15_007333 [Xylaria flabelliformis]
MSQKVTSKNLSYDNSLPPFLARLRGQQTAHSGPDPILAAHRRPGQKRSASEEAEDAPVVVDEDGNVVYLKDGVLDEEDGSAQKDESNKEEPGLDNKEEEEEGDLTQSKEKERVAAIGASRKRKVGRVIREEISDNEKEKEKEKTKTKKDNDDKARIAKASADVRRLIRQDEDNADTRKSTDTVNDKPSKLQQDGAPQQKTIRGTKRKAAKKIKLSFGDDDGE